MAELMLGAPVVESLSSRINQGVELLHLSGITPTVKLVRVGEKESDLSYERGFTKKAQSLGIHIEKCILPESVSEEELLSVIEEINEDDSIHGCLMFRPLPAHLNTRAVLRALLPEKDIDAMTGCSMGSLITQDDIGFSPCTAEACIEVLKYYDIPLKGKNVAMIGSGMAVGMPLSIMMINHGATVSVCHIYTDPEKMAEHCRNADIIISAAGKAGLIGQEHVAPGQIILDVGINVGNDGKLCGDINFKEVEPIVDAITPVPRGVGAVTSTVLADHVVKAALTMNRKREKLYA